MGKDYSIAHALRLCEQLPPQSRCVQRYEPEPDWSEVRSALERLDYHVEHLAWMLSEDGAKRRNKPEPHVPPAQRRLLQEQIEQSLEDKAEVDRILGVHDA